MLEKQDIQTIAEIFHSSMNPIKEELQNVKGEVLGLKAQVQDVQSEVQEVKGQVPGQPHKKYPSWNKNSLMDIFKWFLQFSEKSIPAHTLNDRYTAYSFFYKSFSSFYQIVYPISLGYNKSF